MVPVAKPVDAVSAGWVVTSFWQLPNIKAVIPAARKCDAFKEVRVVTNLNAFLASREKPKREKFFARIIVWMPELDFIELDLYVINKRLTQLSISVPFLGSDT